MSRNKMKIKSCNMDLIYGLVLGDGCVRKPTKKGANTYLDIVHCARHKEYVLYKQRLLNQLGFNTKVTEKKHHSRKDNQFRVKTPSNLFWTDLRAKLYKFRNTDGKTRKKITKDVLSKCTLRTLFFWFLDDGYSNQETSYVQLGIYDFSLEEAELIRDWIESLTGLRMKCYKRKGQPYLVLYKGAEEFKNILSKVMPVPTCMQYKFSSHKTVTDTLRN